MAIKKDSSTQRLIVGTTLLALFMAPSAFAERAGYSYLGLGLEMVSYEERAQLSATDNFTQQVVSLDLNSDFTSSNLAQRFGAYVAVNQDWGFYINGSSTLGSSSESEDWFIDGANVQTDSMSLYRSDTNVWLTRRLADKHWLVFGGSYNRIDYKRFNFELTPEGQALGVELPDDGVVSEEAVELLAEVGYEFNEFFDGQELGWKTQYQVMLGLPVYTSVRNTSVNGDESFTDTFSSYNLRASAGLGYQINESFMISGVLEASYQDRDGATRTKGNITETLPNRTFYYIQPSLNLFWSF